MSLDVGNALAVASDIASDAKNPLTVVSDAIALYSAYQDVRPGMSVGAVLTAMDKDGKLLPAAKALADIAPTLVVALSDPAQKARLLSLAQSL